MMITLEMTPAEAEAMRAALAASKQMAQLAIAYAVRDGGQDVAALAARLVLICTLLERLPDPINN